MNNCNIPSTHAEIQINDLSVKHSFTLYPSLSPYSQMELLTEIQIHSLCSDWRNFFFQLWLCVSFWFWREIGFGFTYLCTLLNNFFETNIFLIVVEVLRYFVRQFRYFCTNFLVESNFSFPTLE